MKFVRFEIVLKLRDIGSNDDVAFRIIRQSTEREIYLSAFKQPTSEIIYPGFLLEWERFTSDTPPNYVYFQIVHRDLQPVISATLCVEDLQQQKEFELRNSDGSVLGSIFLEEYYFWDTRDRQEPTFDNLEIGFDDDDNSSLEDTPKSTVRDTRPPSYVFSENTVIKFFIQAEDLGSSLAELIPDPFLVVSSVSDDGTERAVFHVSEVLEDCCDPKWKAFYIPSEYLEKKNILFEVYDNPGFQEEPSEMIGNAKTSLLELFVLTPTYRGGRPQVKMDAQTNLDLVHQLEDSGIKSGTLVIRAEVVHDLDKRIKNKEICFQYEASFLTNNSVSEISLAIYHPEIKLNVHQSERLPSNKTNRYRWQPFSIKSTHLCFGDMQKKLLFEINSGSTPLASLNISLEQILTRNEFFMKPADLKSSMYIKLRVLQCSLIKSQKTIREEETLYEDDFEEEEDANPLINFQITAADLIPTRRVKDLESVIIISRIEDDSYVELYRSEVTEGFSASWCPFRVQFQDLCNGDLNHEIVIEVLQRDPAHGMVPIGSTLLSVGKFLASLTHSIYRDSRPTGTLEVVQSGYQQSPTNVTQLSVIFSESRMNELLNTSSRRPATASGNRSVVSSFRSNKSLMSRPSSS